MIAFENKGLRRRIADAAGYAFHKDVFPKRNSSLVHRPLL